MVDFKIYRAGSEELFPNGELNPRLIIEEGGWYLCTDTAELFVGTKVNGVLTLKRVNDAEIHQIPVDSLVLKSDIENVKQEVIQTVVPSVEEVKTKVEEVLPKVEVVDSVIDTVAELQAWVNNKDFLEHIDLSGYATEEYVNSKLESIEVPEVDLTGYVTKEEIADFATETFVAEAINGIEIPEPELYKVDFNTPDFAKAVEAYKSGKVLILVNAAPDINSYAVMNYVSDTYITFTKFLMSRSSTYGAFNTYYLRPDNTWELAKEVRLNKVEANVEDEATGALTSLRIGKEIYKLPKLDGYATTEVLNQTLENYVTNDYITQNYVTNNYIVENYTTTEQLEATYVTNEKVTEVVTSEINTVVTEQIETKVTEVIQEKVDTGEISLKAESLSYGTF